MVDTERELFNLLDVPYLSVSLFYLSSLLALLMSAGGARPKPRRDDPSQTPRVVISLTPNRGLCAPRPCSSDSRQTRPRPTRQRAHSHRSLAPAITRAADTRRAGLPAIPAD